MKCRTEAWRPLTPCARVGTADMSSDGACLHVAAGGALSPPCLLAGTGTNWLWHTSILVKWQMPFASSNMYCRHLVPSGRHR